jgi:hypothetical protein
MLRQWPEINSLSFKCGTPSPDITLGRIVGDIPPSISHVVFDSALSSNALQTLCIMLRTRNEAWVHSHRDSNDGLIGLAIKRHKFSREDLQYLLEMLDLTAIDRFSGRPSFDETHPDQFCVSESHQVAHTESLRQHKDKHSSIESDIIEKSGLKYLDLSYCDLSDKDCADILRAATSASSSIEALDFEGNHVGEKFMEALKEVTKSSECRLRYIGLKKTGLSNMVFLEFLEIVGSYHALNGFDVSHNQLNSPSEEKLKKAFKFCFRGNSSLRYADFSYNQFPKETILSVYLALLESLSIQILLLIGNPGVRKCDEYSLIEERLQSNRIKSLTTFGNDDAISSGGGMTKSKHDDSAIRVQLPEAEASYSISSSSVAEASFVSALPEFQVISAENSLQPFDSGTLDESKGLERKVSSTNNVLCVLFSVPLAWKDKNKKLHAIEMLDYTTERRSIWQLFKEVQRDIEVQFDFATTDKLRTAVTLGCRALHFSGHGHPQGLNFEDGKAGLQFVKVDTLRDLCVAGGSQLEFVFVSACHSKLAGEAFAAAGVPHVVCVKLDARLLDSAANVFTRAFYLSLAVGKTVKDSFDIGKQVFLKQFIVLNYKTFFFIDISN